MTIGHKSYITRELLRLPCIHFLLRVIEGLNKNYGIVLSYTDLFITQTMFASLDHLVFSAETLISCIEIWIT